MLWSYCRTVFSVEQRPHESQLEQGEQAVLDGTSKWECKIQVTGTKATVTASGGVRFKSEVLQLLPASGSVRYKSQVLQLLQYQQVVV